MAGIGIACLLPAAAQQGQPLLLSQAIHAGLNNYQSIRAKQNYLGASTALVQNAKNEYLPNVLASLQQDYGTINGQYGPSTPYGAPGVASSGPVSSSQNWNAAFGGLYLINTNWEFFTFGRVHARIEQARAQVRKDSADLLQEQFVHSVRISSAYLNLLVAQRLVQSAQANLDRVQYVQRVVGTRTRTGLNAGVDSSIANAEVSAAKLLLIQNTDYAQQLSNQLTQLLNQAPGDFVLDTVFLSKVPDSLATAFAVEQNPQVKFYQSRIDQSISTADYIRKSIRPGLNLFGIYQGRGSGFDYNYNPVTNPGYSKDYFNGINPVRSNYAVGISLAWNLVSPLKIKHQVRAQQFITEAYRNEYDLVATQLKDQLVLSDQRIANSLRSVAEVPLQYKAAADAYNQKSVLYKNGLANIVDVQQALYALNKAEIDNSVAYVNVWQALLLKAAASGDFNLFLKQVR
ncbi:MAG: TolC family protein [Bacteroidetes bacterium]|nr:TolC family protein [Bacteroidota bacterium]